MFKIRLIIFWPLNTDQLKRPIGQKDNRMTDYTKIESCKLAGVCGTDAFKWAEAFQQIVVDKGLVIDEGLMIGWFANAIEQIRPETLTEEAALHIAARIWCRPETGHIEMNAPLAAAFADVLRNGEPN